MIPDNDELTDLRELILKSHSGQLDDTEVERLNELAGSADGGTEVAALIDQLCALYDYSSLDSPLISNELIDAVSDREKEVKADRSGLVIAGERSESVSSTPVSAGPRRGIPFHWLLVVAASNILVASVVWSVAKSQSDWDRGPMAPLNLTASSAELVAMTACVWRDSSDAVPAVGARIEDGEILDLVEGIAEIRTGEGTSSEALVRIEGPASVAILVDGRLELRSGSLTAKSLGIGSRNVVIDTPVGRVAIDGQSSLGLVANGPVSEVHLFEGRGAFEVIRSKSILPEIRLEAGEAVRFTSSFGEDPSVVMFEATMSTFVSARSAAFDPLDVGQRYVNAVMDSEPSVYWRFEGLGGEFPYFVKNQGSAANMDAVLVGNPGWRQYDGNQATELGNSSESTAFQSEGRWPAEPLDEYTIELWVKPQLYHHGEVLCLHDPKQLKDGRFQHTMMLETTAQHHYTHRLNNTAPNRFRFVHRQLGAPQPISATSLFSGQEYEARAWQHVAVQLKNTEQMLWINGQLSGARSNQVPLDSGVQILLGQVYPDSSYRRFIGQVDEVAIYDRCLSQHELRSHIKAAGRRIAAKVAN